MRKTFMAPAVAALFAAAAGTTALVPSDAAAQQYANQGYGRFRSLPAFDDEAMRTALKRA